MDPIALNPSNIDTFNTKLFLDTYFSSTTDERVVQEFTVNPIKKLQSFISSGYIGGHTLIDISLGHILFPLFPVCEIFKEIIILDSGDKCLNEVRKWLDKDPDAHNWSYASKIVTELRNKSESFQDLEDMTRKKVKDIGICNLTQENPSCTLKLPVADCILAVRTLDVVSKDNNAFRQKLKYLSSLLKVGGHLILVADINGSYFTVGEKKYCILNYDECFLMKTLNEEGYLIKYHENIGNDETAKDYDLEKTVFVAAQKIDIH